jgi:hypothetical protein
MGPTTKLEGPISQEMFSTGKHRVRRRPLSVAVEL